MHFSVKLEMNLVYSCATAATDDISAVLPVELHLQCEVRLFYCFCSDDNPWVSFDVEFVFQPRLKSLCLFTHDSAKSSLKCSDFLIIAAIIILHYKSEFL